MRILVLKPEVSDNSFQIGIEAIGMLLKQFILIKAYFLGVHRNK